MKDRFRSFLYAFRGIFYCFCSGWNARIQGLAALCIAIFGFVVGFELQEWLVVIICIGLVLSLEAINTALEELANYVEPERKPQIGRIKDIAAGAVLIASMASLGVGLILVFKYLGILF